MPRKRRKSKPRLPTGLAEISKLELTHWNVYGPAIGEIEGKRGPGSITKWPDWQTWAEFYERVRDDYVARFGPNTAADRIFLAMLAKGDPEEVVAEIVRELADNDPRKNLRKQN